MQFIDLQAQYRKIKPQVQARINTVLEHGKYILGPECDELEQRLAAYTGRKHCISCANGTDALLMALMALDTGPGDAVFTTTFTFIATAEVIALTGATPVFVDIDEQTYNIDPKKLHEAVMRVEKDGRLALKAIIPVDLFGLCAPYDNIAEIASEFGLNVIEDAAQSFGAACNNEKACCFGDIACTSFFPAKPLGCYGDGGAIFTDDNDRAETLRSIRVHGKGSDKYDNIRIGINGRLDTLQAAILLAKLDIFDEELAAKNKVAQHYSETLKDVVKVPVIPDGSSSAWAQYSVMSDKRDAVCAALKVKGIPTAIYYPKPLHLQTAFKDLGYSEGDFEAAERVSKEIFSLPMHAYLRDEEIQRICEIIAEIA